MGFRLAVVALLAGCDERERITFPSEAPNAGPITTIQRPAADTVLAEGDPFVLDGRSVDTDGVDTVYFEVFGLNLAYPPLAAGGGETVPFGLTIPTAGLSGTSFQVWAYGVDLRGARGGTAVRQFTIE